jgi:4-oxalocrotonate tautomerase
LTEATYKYHGLYRITYIDFNYAASSPIIRAIELAKGAADMPFANVKVPQGTLKADQKEEIIHKITQMFCDYFGDGSRPYTMVLVDEVVDGGWGRADETFTIAKMQAMQKQSAG